MERFKKPGTYAIVKTTDKTLNEIKSQILKKK